MQNNISIKRPVLIISLVILGLAGMTILAIIFWSTQSENPAVSNANPPDTTTKTVSVKSSPPSGNLPLLPEDFPIDKNAVIANNYAATSPAQTDVQQYTRTYSSKKTLADLYNMYVNYLTKNKWDIRNKTITQQVGSVSATKDQVAVNITLQQLGSARLVVLTVGQSAEPFVPSETGELESNRPRQ